MRKKITVGLVMMALATVEECSFLLLCGLWSSAENMEKSSTALPFKWICQKIDEKSGHIDTLLKLFYTESKF